MPRIQIHYLVFLALLVSGRSVLADAPTEARQWLEKMSSALQALNYQGVFVYRQEDELSAMRVTHIADVDAEYELLETLSGESREEVRNSRQYRGLIAPNQNDAATVTNALADIEHHYDLQMAGNDRAAGRSTRLITVIPKDALRYGYRLWLDEQTGLLLKSDLLDEQQQILEQVMFTSLQLLSQMERQKFIDEARLASSTAKQEAIRDSVAQPTQVSDWTISAMPKGFVLVDNRSTAAQADAEQMVFSDGLASVSVFVEPAKGDNPFVGTSRMGAVNAYGDLRDGYQLTVVGEVPAVTVKMIGESIERVGESQ